MGSGNGGLGRAGVGTGRGGGQGRDFVMFVDETGRAQREQRSLSLCAALRLHLSFDRRHALHVRLTSCADPAAAGSVVPLDAGSVRNAARKYKAAADAGSTAKAQSQACTAVLCSFCFA